MALYAYEAVSSEGKKIRGTIDAPSIAAVREHIRAMGAYPVSIAQTTQQDAAVGWWQRIQRMFQRTVTLKEKILFTKQLAVLLKSGVPLLQAVELLVEQFEGRMHTILIEVKDGIKEGASLADGLANYPKVFDTIYVQLVRAGEATGNLEMILDRLVDYLERQEALAKKVKGALQYPMIQMGIIMMVTVFLLVVVVPQMAENFAQRGTALPGPTQFLLNLSNFATAYYPIIGLGLIALVFAWRYWVSTPGGAKTWDRIKLKIPIVGYFTRMNAVVQFCRTLGILVEGGVNLSQALDIVVKIIDNRILADALEQARDKIIKQGKIAQYLQQTQLFPKIAIYLIKTGEESGQLGQMLLTVANNYEADLQEYADGLAARLQPFMLIFMAVVVGFIVLAIALPIVQMNETLTL